MVKAGRQALGQPGLQSELLSQILPLKLHILTQTHPRMETILSTDQPKKNKLIFNLQEAHSKEADNGNKTLKTEFHLVTSSRSNVFTYTYYKVYTENSNLVMT